MAAGRPVVSTAFPHAVELLPDGPGLVVPQRDPAALAGALRRVLTEPGLADRMAALKATTGNDLGPAKNAGPFGEVIANVVAPSQRKAAAAG